MAGVVAVDGFGRVCRGFGCFVPQKVHPCHGARTFPENDENEIYGDRDPAPSAPTVRMRRTVELT